MVVYVHCLWSFKLRRICLHKHISSQQFCFPKSKKYRALLTATIWEGYVVLLLNYACLVLWFLQNFYFAEFLFKKIFFFIFWKSRKKFVKFRLCSRLRCSCMCALGCRCTHICAYLCTWEFESMSTSVWGEWHTLCTYKV